MTTNRESVLVVDDKLENLKLLVQALAKEDYEVRPVPSGSQALAAAHGLPPSLILLDINMPEMNGYEVCEALKAKERTRDIPVIFVSALDEPLDKTRAFAVGGVDYVSKPFQLAEVLARVRTHLALRRLGKEREETIARLEQALAEVRTLRGLLPICAGCKMIRDDDGNWQRIESYVSKRTEATFTHGICPDCARRIYPKYWVEAEDEAEDRP